MAISKAYLGDELRSKMAQKLIYRLTFGHRLDPDDQVLAAFGNVGLTRVDCAISTKGHIFC